MIMFMDIMNATRLGQIMEAGLLPFVIGKFSNGHYDNDPKHASNYIEHFFEANNVEWWPSPPESLDLNPIENVNLLTAVPVAPTAQQLEFNA